MPSGLIKHGGVASTHLRSYAMENHLKILATFDFDKEGKLPVYISNYRNFTTDSYPMPTRFSIEEDVKLRLNSYQVESMKMTPWHLLKIASNNESGGYPYEGQGSCHRNASLLINTYVVDTGIDITHPLFENRAKWGANFADETDTDCNHHGTHVAGLIGAQGYGVCRDANLYAVKVLNCKGSGTMSGLIKGIEWVYNKHKQSKGSRVVKSIVNLSLGAGKSKALDMIVDACVSKDDNFYVVVAAGNKNEDACSGSPSGVKTVLSVMASDENDNRAWFSNWGKCAGIYAPGVNIWSVIPNNKTARLTGTSFAAPITTGVVNHLIDDNSSLNMRGIVKHLKEMSRKAAIKNIKPYTNSDVLYLSRTN
jgi:cerevisin